MIYNRSEARVLRGSRNYIMEDSAQINKAKNQSRKKGKKGEEGRRNIPKMPLESPVQDAPHSAIEYFVQYSNKKKVVCCNICK